MIRDGYIFLSGKSVYNIILNILFNFQFFMFCYWQCTHLIRKPAHLPIHSKTIFFIRSYNKTNPLTQLSLFQGCFGNNRAFCNYMYLQLKYNLDLNLVLQISAVENRWTFIVLKITKIANESLKKYIIIH